MSDWPGVRLHVVTGKGGTGKSTVAASLALALASHGKNVLLCEVEGRQGIARMFDVDPLPYAERRVALGLPTDGQPAGVVHALHIDPEAALLEYLAMYYRLGRAGRALDRFGVIEFATTIAPGVRDVLLTGKVYEAVQRNSRNKGAIEYDAVVLDAPPTGRITQFLNVSDELAGLAKVGPIKKQADTMMTLFRSPRTAVHFVTVLEEMPVQETADGHRPRARGRAAGRRRGRQPGPAPRPAGQGPGRRPQGRARPGGDHRRPRLRRRPARERPGRRAARARPATTPYAARSRTPSASSSRGSTSRPTSCPGWPRASTWAASTSLPADSATRDWHDPGAEPGRPPGDPTHERSGARRRRAARRPADQHHRLLRLGRGRQDHHLGGTRAPRGRTRPQGRRPHHRPGAPTGSGDGDRGARQHARVRWPASHRSRRARSTR